MKNLLEAERRRAVLDKAKALLILKNGWDEPTAHRFLQLKSMNSRKSLSEIAEAFLLSEELMPTPAPFVNGDDPGTPVPSTT